MAVHDNVISSVRNGLGARAAPRGNCQEDWTADPLIRTVGICKSSFIVDTHFCTFRIIISLSILGTNRRTAAKFK